MKKEKNFWRKKIRSHLHQFHLKGRRVFVRIDGNVPLRGTSIANDYRLKAVLPTLQFIKQHGGTIVLITHIGRPKNPTPALSTKILQPWFEQHDFTVTFAHDIPTAYQKSLEKAYDIVLLDNIRFFAVEKERNCAFARELARLGEYYVNDAFATLHRNDTSVTLVAKEFSPEHRTIGLLIEKELKTLSTLCINPQQPFVVILGGGKPETKIPVIAALLDKADTIMIYPALVFTFNKALSKEVGQSLVDDSLLETAKSILNQASTSRATLLFPIDYIVLDKTIEGPLITVTQKEFSQDSIGISLGPQSLEEAKHIIAKAGTIFFNCAMGFSQRTDTLQGSFSLLQSIAQSPAQSIIAGGSSVELAFRLGLQNQFNYLSTGGGATLAYLSSKALPGLDIFL